MPTREGAVVVAVVADEERAICGKVRKRMRSDDRGKGRKSHFPRGHAHHCHRRGMEKTFSFFSLLYSLYYFYFVSIVIDFRLKLDGKLSSQKQENKRRIEKKDDMF